MINQDKNPKEKFFDALRSQISDHRPFKVTVSKPRDKKNSLKNIFVKTLNNIDKYALTYAFKTHDDTKVEDGNGLIKVIEREMKDTFLNVSLFTSNEEFLLIQNLKGNARFSVKKSIMEVQAEPHNKQKSRFISEDSEWLFQLGLAGKDGKIYDKSQKKFRQIQKYLEIIDALLDGKTIEQPFTVADMGSGKGYLTFALYDYLTNVKNIRCQVTGYEIREDLVTQCYHVAMNCGFVGLTFRQKSIKDVNANDIQMVIALHACDIATDMAIAKGIQAGTNYILVAPCCHAQVRKSMNHNNILSPILKHGILEGKQAEVLTDGLRALIMRANGYKSKVIEFISPENTSKNLMIIGEKDKSEHGLNNDIKQIKAFFGISSHYLEEILEGRVQMDTTEVCETHIDE
ncbi:MAG: SAM-dependent methyltransferase [Saprospiraceae bacterium]